MTFYYGLPEVETNLSCSIYPGLILRLISRRGDRTCTSMGDAASGTISSWYVLMNNPISGTTLTLRFENFDNYEPTMAFSRYAARLH